MPADNAIAIEVVYCCEHEQHVIQLAVRAGTTVGEAVHLSGLAGQCCHFDEHNTSVGIYGRVVTRCTVLGSGDRVEIYRPLIADPKQARRRRALRQR